MHPLHTPAHKKNSRTERYIYITYNHRELYCTVYQFLFPFFPHRTRPLSITQHPHIFFSLLSLLLSRGSSFATPRACNSRPRRKGKPQRIRFLFCTFSPSSSSDYIHLPSIHTYTYTTRIYTYICSGDEYKETLKV